MYTQSKVILYADIWNLLSSGTVTILAATARCVDGTSKHSPSRTPQAGCVFLGHATKACHVTVGQRLPALASLF